MMVAPERTGWRDQEISARHRLWGFACPAVDIDFLLLEYDSGNPTALIEYKNERARQQSLCHPTYQALKKLADDAKIPLIVCRYKTDFSVFTAEPLNDLATLVLPKKTHMLEPDWIVFLHKMRGREMSSGLIRKDLALRI